ncbi:MAG: hypothetical protein A2381_15820 [Bdellovibrionales bacterium RIFOXYB1_FULL_37_110]|nr:MAG: hypothetical protein A2417_07670 [Bdellovibrionales bacterium RIFOXYC1_FULL_37_79]OFZ57082.1 MAG: hypothetical protein A2381_15820 [Bdellovibrionales bacterium RIFOXYB1_FULL_37_110]OFZ62067.1 MAG: hypothetical protein A2577_08410 [Bdellovibrionales bacterium RIFOXYD1_FULL_36_51]
MNNCQLLFILLCVFITPYSLAGHDTGNGGDGLICKNLDGTIKSIELLDYYEATVRDLIPINLGPDNQYQSMLSYVIKRLEQLSPQRAKIYQEQLSAFLIETKFLNDTIFLDIPDSAHDFIPAGCSIEQLAIQRKKLLKYDKKYFINNDYWPHLPPRDQAGLLLHEVIYTEALNYGHQNSKLVRKFNGYLSSDQIQNHDWYDFASMIQKFKMGYIEYQGLILNHFGLGFCPDDEQYCINGYVDSGVLSLNGTNYQIEGYVNINRNKTLNCADTVAGQFVTINQKIRELAPYKVKQRFRWSLCQNNKNKLTEAVVLAPDGYEHCTKTLLGSFKCQKVPTAGENQ